MDTLTTIFEEFNLNEKPHLNEFHTKLFELIERLIYFSRTLSPLYTQNRDIIYGEIEKLYSQIEYCYWEINDKEKYELHKHSDYITNKLNNLEKKVEKIEESN